MQRKVTCCHDCQEREIGCHSTCKKYIEENEQYLKEREKIKTEKTKKPQSGKRLYVINAE